MLNPIRLFLVDSSPLFRSSLTALLNRRRVFRVIGEAASGTEALAKAGALRPDVAIVEPRVPEGGPDLVTGLSAGPAACTVLVLTDLNEDAAGGFLQAGALGYLPKACAADDLAVAIRRVHGGELVVSPSVTGTVLKQLNPDPTSAVERLTGREIEVLALVAQGMTNAQIARKLNITEHTVKGHLVKLLSKLGLENRVQLATHALQHGFANPTTG